MEIKLNPDIVMREMAQKAVKDNDGYCPCCAEKTADSKCMCKWFRENKEEGICHCGLYIKTKE